MNTNESFPQPTDEQQAAYTSYLENKYPEHVREATVFQPNEDPLAYLARIKEIFPEPVQQVVLEGMWHATYAGGLGIHAIAHARSHIAPPAKLAEYFPTVYPTNSNAPYRVTMAPDRSAEVIFACNTAAYQVTEYGMDFLKRVRQEVKETILGKNVGQDLSVPEKFRVKKAQLTIKAIKALGENVQSAVETEIDRQIEETVTLRTIGLNTDIIASAFQHISSTVGDEYDPFEVFAETILFTADIDSLNIYPSVVEYIQEASLAYFNLSNMD